MPNYKEAIRNILGEIPLTAEFYYELKKKNQPFTRSSLKNIQANLLYLLRFITGSNMQQQWLYTSALWGIM